MVTFKQYIQEGTERTRYKHVLYSAVNPALQGQVYRRFDEVFQKLAHDLQLPERYGKQKMHVQLWPRSHTFAMEVSLPIPDGMDADEVEFFSKVALTVMKKHFGEPIKVQFKNSNRAYFDGIERFSVHLHNRRKDTDKTNGDTMTVMFEVDDDTK